MKTKNGKPLFEEVMGHSKGIYTILHPKKGQKNEQRVTKTAADDNDDWLAQTK